MDAGVEIMDTTPKEGGPSGDECANIPSMDWLQPTDFLVVGFEHIIESIHTPENNCFLLKADQSVPSHWLCEVSQFHEHNQIGLHMCQERPHSTSPANHFV